MAAYYTLIQVRESGELSVDSYSREDMEDFLNSEESGSIKFITLYEATKTHIDSWGVYGSTTHSTVGLLLKGDAVIPKAVITVTKMEID